MRTRKITEAALHDGLAEVNRRYEGNIRFRTLERIGNDKNGHPKYTFTLTVESSRNPGAKRSHTGRRISAACWHVHGHFFDEVFRICPEGRIESSGRTLTAEDHWPDWNIGSQYYPLLFSEACDC